MKIATHSIRRMIVAGAACTAVVLTPAAAFADPYTEANPPSVSSVDNVAVQPRVQTAGATPATNATGAAATLPVTGSDLVSLAVLGFGAVGVGTALVLKTRTRQPEAA